MSTYSVATVSSVTNTVFLNSSQLQSNSNTLTTTTGTRFFNDIVLCNGTTNKIVFNQNGTGDPSVSNRSLGTKLIFKATISATNVDVATGVNGTNLWFSVPTATDTFTFWNGSTPKYTLGQYGISTLTAATATRTSDTLAGTPANLTTNGDIVLNNSTANTILFAAAGSAPPASGTRSLGTRFVLFPNIANNLDAAIGVSGNNVWLTTPTAGAFQICIGTVSPIFNVSTATVACLATTSTGNSNTPTGALTVAGDGVIGGTLYFTSAANGLPLFNSRSSGSRIVFKAAFGGTTTDTAIGYKGSTSDASGGIYFGLGANEAVDIYNRTTKVAQLGTVVKIMDTTGSTLIQINPSKEDILSPIKETFSAPAINTPITIAGLKFTNSATRAFDAVVIAEQISLGNSLYERHDIQAVQVAGNVWVFTDETLGDDIAIDFSVNGSGQVFFSVPSTSTTLNLSYTAKTIPVI